MKITAVEFAVPSASDFPPVFSGYVCLGFAGGRWFSGCDPDSELDAFQRMQDAARLALIPAVTVDKQLDPSFFNNTVQMLEVRPDA